MMDATIYVISLAKRNPRRAAIAARLSELCLNAVIWDAVDGRDGLGDTAEIDRDGTLAFCGRVLSDAEYACALSHRAVYRDFLSSDADYAIVLEDDALLDDKFTAFVTERHYRKAPMLLLHHRNARVYGACDAIADHRLHPLAMSPFMAAAYSVNRASATALNNALTPVRSTADWPLDLSDLGAMAVVPEIAGHPPMGQGSDLAQSRGAAHRRWSHVLSAAYLRRKWRKMLSRKIS